MSTVLYNMDCLDVMGLFIENESVDSIVTDPPYGIRFMGKSWDGADIDARAAKRRSFESHAPGAGPNGGHKSAAAEAGKYDLKIGGMRAFQEFSEAWAREAFRVLKPGGYLLSFASARTYHRMTAGIEDAGFEIRDQLLWIYGSGFPKSHNGEWGGTALKPAHEPICLARKPLVGTVEANWRLHGTGALNIDCCRVPTADPLGGGAQKTVSVEGKGEGWQRPWMHDGEAVAAHVARVNANVDKAEALGRWPANILHDGSDEVVAMFPESKGAQGDVKGTEKSRTGGDGAASYGEFGRVPSTKRGDTGSAARFFYCPKASRKDRNEGLADPGPQFTHGATLRDIENTATTGNSHPTVKPTDLMAYLCRLVTPAGGLVLDPFMGSGSTGKAAVREGFRFVGAELEVEYFGIAEARIAHEKAKVSA